MQPHKKPHVHAETIKAWADGAEIEVYVRHTKQWLSCETPSWWLHSEYRVKPQPHKYQSLLDDAMKGDLSVEFQTALGTGYWTPLFPQLESDFPDGVDYDVVLRRRHRWQKEIDAYNTGKAIQYRSTPDHSWLEGTHWAWGGSGEYRIKPERVEQYLQISQDSLQWKREGNLKLVFEDDVLIDAVVLKGK